MQILEWLRFGIGTIVLLAGLLMFAFEMYGSFRFKYVLNRMHLAAIGDTFGIGISLVGLMIMSGWNFTTLKMGLVIIFLWCASPVSSHLISRLEVYTNEHLEEYCDASAIQKSELEFPAEPEEAVTEQVNEEKQEG